MDLEKAKYIVRALADLDACDGIMGMSIDEMKLHIIVKTLAETKKQTIQECIDRLKKLKRMEPQDTGLGVDYICVGCANTKQDCQCEILNRAFNEAMDKLKEIKLL